MRQQTGRRFGLGFLLGLFCVLSASVHAACDPSNNNPPEINFSASQIVGYGDAVAVQLYASKPLCAPLQVGYSVAGTATPISDHDAIAGVVTLTDNKAAQILFHTVAKPASGAPDKTIEINLQSSSEWQAGARATHVVLLSETIRQVRASVLVQQHMDYAFLHQRVQQACATCHDGINAVGRTQTHPATPAVFDCSACHTSTTSFAGSSGFVHPVVTSSCASCHAKDKPVQHFPTPRNTDCSACHSVSAVTLSWTQASFDHATAPEIRCDNCHNGSLVGPASKPVAHIAIVAGEDCSVCHNSAAWIPATPATTTLARALNAPELPNALADMSPRIGRVLARDQGKVALLAQVMNYTHRKYRYVWDTTALGTAHVIGRESAWLILDPSTLTAGLYQLTATIIDIDSPDHTATTQIDLLVLDTLPPLSETNDSDGDGIVDASEGYTDDNNNGIAAFGERGNATDVLPIKPFTAGTNLVRATPGLQLALGTAAFTAQNNTATVSSAALLSSGTITADAANTVVDHTLLDIRVNGSNPINSDAELVMPLTYLGSTLKFLARNGTWTQIDNAQQELLKFAAADAIGNCPNTMSSAYQTTATANSNCVELRIQDNGELDLADDNNGEVRFIVAIAPPATAGSVSQPVTVDTTTDSGGGSVGFGLSVLLAAIGLSRRRRTRTVA